MKEMQSRIQAAHAARREQIPYAATSQLAPIALRHVHNTAPVLLFALL